MGQSWNVNKNCIFTDFYLIFEFIEKIRESLGVNIKVYSSHDFKIGFNFRLDDRHIRGSTNSDLKLPPESDTDSIQDYVDGETAGKLL